MDVALPYFPQLLRCMHSLRKQGRLCDTTLVTSEGNLSAHGVVLAAASPVFEAALLQAGRAAGQTSAFRLEMVGVNLATMEEVLELVYLGRCENKIATEEESRFKDVCQQLGLDRIKYEASSLSEGTCSCCKQDPQCCACGFSSLVSNQHIDNASVTPPIVDTEDDNQAEASEVDDPSNNDCSFAIAGPSEDQGSHSFDVGGDGGSGLEEYRLEIVSTDAGFNELSGDLEHVETDRCCEGPSAACYEQEAVASEAQNSVNECDVVVHSSIDLNSVFDAACLSLSENHMLLDEYNTDHRQALIDSQNVTELCMVDDDADEKFSSLEDDPEIVDVPELGVTPVTVCSRHQCADCGRQFPYASHLLIHRRRHTGVRPFQCTVCARQFRVNCLRKHMLTHTGERPYPCDECDHRFALAGDLDSHRRATHAGERPYTCAQCGRAFAKRSDLTRHTRVHTGERPYVCEECGKAFKISFHLLAHAAVHVSERAHACASCNKAFSSAARLKKHQVVHNGKQPHKCAGCSRSFAKHANLRAHLKVHEARLAGTSELGEGGGMLDEEEAVELLYFKIEGEEERVLQTLPYDVIESLSTLDDIKQPSLLDDIKQPSLF